MADDLSLVALFLGAGKGPMADLPLVAVIVGAAIIGLLAHLLGLIADRRALPRTGAVLERSLVKRARAPLLAIFPLASIGIAMGIVRLRPSVEAWLSHLLSILLVASIAWLGAQMTYVVEDVILARFSIEDADNLRARRIRTQIQVFRRIVVVLVIVLAAAVILLSFRQVRAAGAGLLASAGLIGLMAGVAAKPVATNVLAGMQIAISQPIRVDDVVVVQGEWGRIEEINLTYVVVRIWDLRRLVLPISWFITNTFENWTRSSAALLGYVHMEVDFQTPIDELRKHLGEMLAQHPLWDRQVWNLQATQWGPTTLQLRALMSTRDSSSRWDLECAVREEMVTWLNQRMPESLPRYRAEFPIHDNGADPTAPEPNVIR